MIAITGSNGFVGQALMRSAQQRGISVRAIGRDQYCSAEAYTGCDVVVHLAGLAHRKQSSKEAFDEVNHTLCIRVARAAERAGVKRIVLVSSSKALRDYSLDEAALKEDQPALPGCDYGRSKLAAETSLLNIASEGNLECVIVRPALIIGSPPKANLAMLATIASGRLNNITQGVFNGFTARRSVTSLRNLVSALWVLCEHPAAAGEVFHVVDADPVSAGQLFHGLRLASRVATGTDSVQASLPAVFSKVAVSLVRWVLRISGRGQSLNALDKPLVLDGGKIQRTLTWHPENCLDSELQQIMMFIHNMDDSNKG